MSPSRPVHPAAGRHHPADGGDPAGRHRRLPVPAGLRPARGRLPDHPGADLLSGRQPEVMTSSVTSPLEVQFGQMPSLNQMFSTSSAGCLGDHAAVQPGRQPGCRRAGSAGGDQRGRQPAAVRPAGAADLRQGQSGGRADPDPGADLQDAAADPGRGSGRHPAGAEDLAAARRRPGQHQRRPAAGGARPGQSARARRLWAEHRRSAHHARQRQRQHAEGQFRRAGAGLDDQRQRPDHRSHRNTSTW